MIDFTEEPLISLQEAAKILPRRRAGRPVHTSCIYRWTQNGVKGIKLESVQVGGCRCTSQAALNRFFSALTAQSEAGRRSVIAPEAQRLPAHRRKAIAEAEKKLKEAGI
jgi:hypothetical protein